MYGNNASHHTIKWDVMHCAVCSWQLRTRHS